MFQLHHIQNVCVGYSIVLLHGDSCFDACGLIIGCFVEFRLILFHCNIHDVVWISLISTFSGHIHTAGCIMECCVIIGCGILSVRGNCLTLDRITEGKHNQQTHSVEKAHCEIVIFKDKSLV